MFEVVLLFLLGFITGSLVVLYFINKSNKDSPGSVGTLRIIQDDGDPYIFLELNDNLGILYNSKEVKLNVEKTSVSQK